jgi:hypothetical protein
MELLQVVSPAPRDTWMRAARTDPTASGAQLPEWADSVIEHGHWHDSSRAYTFSSGRTVVVPMVAKRVAGVAVAERAWPEGWAFAGPVAEGGVREEELDAIVGDLAGSHTPTLAMRLDRIAAAPERRNLRVTPHSTHMLDLSGGFDAWQSMLSRNARRALRRAETEPLEILKGNRPDLVDQFATLNRYTIDRWARDRRQPLPVARALASLRDRPGRLAVMIRHFGDACVLWVARLDDAPVACAVAVFGPATTTDWMSAIDKDRLAGSQASLLLKKHMIAESCARGMTAMDVGEADPGSGMEAFKERIGAVRRSTWELSVGWLPTDRMVETARRALGRQPRPSPGPVEGP